MEDNEMGEGGREGGEEANEWSLCLCVGCRAERGSPSSSVTCMGLMVAAAKGGTHVPKNHPFDAQLLEINIEYRSTASGISISDLIRPSSNHVPKNIKYQYVLEHGPCSPLQP